MQIEELVSRLVLIVNETPELMPEASPAREDGCFPSNSISPRAMEVQVSLDGDGAIAKDGPVQIGFIVRPIKSEN